MKFCENCYTKHDNNIEKCPVCGSKLLLVVNPTQNSKGSYKDTKSGIKEKLTKPSKTLFFVFLCYSCNRSVCYRSFNF